MNVKGIGEKSFLKLKPLLTVTREGRPVGGSERRHRRWSRGPRGPTPGFTILELLFALAIAGTLTTIAVPQGLRALDDFRTRSAARYLAQRLGDARLSAIKRSQAHGLRFEPAIARLPHHDGRRRQRATGCARRRSSAAIDRTLTEPESLAAHFRTSRSASSTACPDADGQPANGSRRRARRHVEAARR